MGMETLMKLLAIETSSTACSAALTIENEITSHHEVAPLQQARQILPMIDHLMSSNQIKLNQLDALAFGCGPGSFTGVRIATSVMQGLGFALNKPLISISSLAALAQEAYELHGWRQILVCVDARIHEVYWGFYKVNETGLAQLIGQEQVSSPQNIHLEEGWFGAGNGWEVYKDQFITQPLKKDSTILPTATAILTLAKPKFKMGQWIKTEEALPTYLRDNVAKKMDS